MNALPKHLSSLIQKISSCLELFYHCASCLEREESEMKIDCFFSSMFDLQTHRLFAHTPGLAGLVTFKTNKHFY